METPYDLELISFQPAVKKLAYKQSRVGQKKLFFEIQKKGVLKSWKIS